MAELHFYAAGPNKRARSNKYWENGTSVEERTNITELIQTELDWMAQTGYKPG